MAKIEAAVDALELIKQRNSFYRNNYRRMVLIVLMLTAVNVILGLALSYYITHRDQPSFFATTATGDIVPLRPLPQPLVSKEALLSWAQEAATASLTYDFVNYRRQISALQDKFTRRGWRNFIRALSASDLFNTVKAKGLVVSATPTAEPPVLNTMVISGQRVWNIEIPMLVSFESVSERKVERMKVTLRVVRVDALENDRGLGIEQYLAESMGSGGR